MTTRMGFLAVTLFFIAAVLFLPRQAGPEGSESQDGLDSAASVAHRLGLLSEEVSGGEILPVSEEEGDKQQVFDPDGASLTALSPEISLASGVNAENPQFSLSTSSPQEGVPAAGDQPCPSLLFPVEGAQLTSPFGPRGKGMHWGIDLAAPEGRPVRAAAAGEVVFAGWHGAYGLLIILEHAGFRTYYAHNATLLVEKNQQVAAGEIIATVGRTGRATGSHLHFELEIQGRKVNPLPYLERALKAMPAGSTGLDAKNGISATEEEKDGGNGEK
jgi:hypothetical protein